MAGLPDVTLRAGGKVAVVNMGPTPFDGRAALKIDAPAGDVLEETLGVIG